MRRHLLAAAVIAGLAGATPLYAQMEQPLPGQTGNTMQRSDDAMKATDKPALPAGVTAKELNDQQDEREVLIEATNAALTKGGFDDLTERLSSPDRARVHEFANQEFSQLDGRIEQIRQNWKTKYNQDFKLTDEHLRDFVKFREGEVTDPQALQAAWPVSPTMGKAIGAAARDVGDAIGQAVDRAVDGTVEKAGDQQRAANSPETVKLLDKGRNVSIAYIPHSHGLPAVNASLLHEAIDDWRIDVPDNLTGQQIYDRLSTALMSFGDNVAAWPSDVNDAYRQIAHRVLLSVYNVNVNEDAARTAGERQTPQR